MNSQLLVQVFVETETDKWKRATGCVVASDRVLTAAHVFKGRKAGLQCRNILSHVHHTIMVE